MMHGDGRALRFIAIVASGWVGLRVFLLWPHGAALVDAARGVLPLPRPALAAPTLARKPATPTAATPRPAVRNSPPPPLRTAPPAPSLPAMPLHVSLASTEPVAMATPPEPPQTAFVGPLPLTPTSGPSRLSVSAWFIARSGVSGTPAGAIAPQLGGTQGGVRVDYRLTHGFAATVRVAAPAAGAGREVSFGIAWRPARVPVRVVVEQRVALDGARGGPSAGISGGVDAQPLPAGFRLEAYGQAGIIVREQADRFIDGSARATRAVATLGRIELDAGAGAWGGAQRGVARFDIGPSVGARIPVGDSRLRIALDWRQRIAGNARPDSGPALTLGTDF